jgi:hypothetical protein
LNALGKPLQIGSLAVDRHEISFRTQVRILNLPAPWDTQLFASDDVGSKINHKHVDVYCGLGASAHAETFRITGGGRRLCKGSSMTAVRSPSAMDAKPDPSKVSLSTAEQRLSDEHLNRAQRLEVSTDPDSEEDGLAALPSITAQVARPIPSVRWPANDAMAPDYAHVSGIPGEPEFELTAGDFDTLIKLNAFLPAGKNDTLTVAIRGAVLKSGNETEEVDTATLKDIRPDHQNFHCLIGFYFRARRKVTLFSGSTVPCPRYMENYYRRKHDIEPYSTQISCNMLPNGCYVFRVASHASGTIKPALRMTDPADFSTDGTTTVLRTQNDLTYATDDDWDQPGLYYDNVHCSYFTSFSDVHRAYFSSAGCLTVRGKKAPSDQWRKFQAVLNQLGQGARTDLILLTGKELAIASDIRTRLGGDSTPLGDLRRLRLGSQGNAVTRLQAKLGLPASDYFGALTRKRLTEVQQTKGAPKDGIFTPALDRAWGWSVFDPPVA